MELMPQGDADAMKMHIDSLPFSAKFSVLLSLWLGTAAGAAIAASWAPVSLQWRARQSKVVAAMPGWIMGVWFLIGGIANAAMIPMPTWMLVTDLMGYIPAAYLTARAVLNLKG